jgi:hypothetical protein
MKQIEIIKSCIDGTAGFEHMTKEEQLSCSQEAINTLGSYPKPQHKRDKKQASKNLIGAYLYVSNARNYYKMGLYRFTTICNAQTEAYESLTIALSLLLDF